MTQFLDGAGIERLEKYFDEIGEVLGDERRRASFAMYAMGLFGEGERKSVEPIAARACGDPDETERAHDRLLHFMTDSKWSDRGVRSAAAKHALSAMTAREPVLAWIVDDTGQIKQGTHSVGVQRQYTGTAGKVTNCQIAVSLSISTKTEHVPVDFELYLPKTWTGDAARRQEARIPDEIEFRTKPELALDMIRRAVADELPPGVVLADSAYGDGSDFREQIRLLNLDYAVGVHGTTKVWRVDRFGRRRGEALSAKKLALQMGRKKFRSVLWRDGTRGQLWSRFARLRVVAEHDDGWDAAEREDLWLLIEWPDNEKEPTKYTLSSLPRATSAKQLVRVVKERYRTERVYEDLKGELGFDHYEGRRFPGWHHHISVVLCCFAFIVAERVRRFPPSYRRQARAHAQSLAA
ncbi:MAG: IS701-like element ISBj9 family transposase [Candidatus Dormibacteraceae bacterium]